MWTIAGFLLIFWLLDGLSKSVEVGGHHRVRSQLLAEVVSDVNQ